MKSREKIRVLSRIMKSDVSQKDLFMLRLPTSQIKEALTALARRGLIIYEDGMYRARMSPAARRRIRRKGLQKWVK